MKYSYITIGLLVSIILLVIYNNYSIIEGFTQTNHQKWSSDLIRRFNIYQTTMNDNANQFNLELLQQQASPEEAEELLKTGYWPWSEELKQSYIEHVWASPLIKIEPQYALDYAMRLYNQQAATELLAWNSKEGEFLLYGGTGRSGNTIKCSNNMVMTKNDVPLTPEDIPNEMPGFKFVGEPCDPCKVFDDNNSNPICPFKLNVEGDDSISVPWRKLWNM